MGLPSGLLGLFSDVARFESEHPPHRVSLESFLICRTECTQEAWDRVGGNDQREWKGDGLPIVNVSWIDCVDWCSKAGLRLPTEAEWEYACRAGTRSRFSFGDAYNSARLADFAWYLLNSDHRLHPVTGKEPNAFGLFDMHGNVWEWCRDTYQHGYQGAPVDGSAWERPGTAYRVKRGGSFSDRELNCRSAWRDRSRSDRRWKNIGFRPAVSLPRKPGR
jgi:formylglycine-generating enzyme required for sulfatase activity